MGMVRSVPRTAQMNSASAYVHVSGGAPSALAGAAAQSNAAIAKTTFTTRGLPASRQFDAYRAYCAPVIDILPNEGSGLGFDASCEMWMLGRLALRRIHTPAGQFSRSAAQVRRDGLDHWVFNLVRRGSQEAHAATGTIRTGPDVLSVFSLAGAYDARRTDVDWLGLFVPRGIIPSVDAAFKHNQHLVLDGPLGRIFAAYLISLADELPSMTEGDLAGAIEVTQGIVASCTASSAPPLNSDDSCFDAPRLRRVRDIIDRNLGSWTLHTGRLCKAAGISRSNLYRMFEPYGGVVRYIQQQRLRRAHDMLADPACTRRISVIASDCCFSDASTFSRAFRHEFGYSPSELRKWEQGENTAPAHGQPPQRTVTMGSWGLLYHS